MFIATPPKSGYKHLAAAANTQLHHYEKSGVAQAFEHTS